MWNLCSGNTWAKPSAFSIAFATTIVVCCFSSPRLLASRIFMPIPSVLAVSLAMASASPVTIWTCTPMCCAVAMVALASSRGGSNRGSTPRNRHLPSPSVRATPSERKPRAANSLTALSTAGFTCVPSADNAKMTCGAPFVTLNAFPSGPVTAAASVRLCTGSKRLEMAHLVAFQGLIVFQAAQNGQVDGVVIVGA